MPPRTRRSAKIIPTPRADENRDPTKLSALTCREKVAQVSAANTGVTGLARKSSAHLFY
jgi:hypothetical protein